MSKFSLKPPACVKNCAVLLREMHHGDVKLSRNFGNYENVAEEKFECEVEEVTGNWK
jgi:hypothetical protein